MSRLLWWLHICVALATVLAYASPYISPLVFWPASFAALAYPSFLIAHLLLGGYWIYRGRWRWVLSVAVVALGFSHVRELYGFGSAKARPLDGPSISFATYNLLGGRRVHVKDSLGFRQNLAALAECVQADVVAVEEYPNYEAVAQGIADTLAAHGLAYGFDPEESTLGLFSRYPLIEPRLEEVYNTVNGIVTAKVIPQPGDTVFVVAAHLQSNQISLDAGELVRDAANARREAYWTLRSVGRNYREGARTRVEQAERIAALVAQSPYPVVVLGDFNDTPLSFALGTLRRAGLVDAFRQRGLGWGITYPGKLPGLRIDYVLATEQLRPLAAGVTKCNLSDHRPTHATFALPSGGMSEQ